MARGGVLILGVVALSLAGCSGSLPRFTSGVSGESLRLEGEASFYGEEFEGRQTSSGETYRGRELTAAHRTLPFGTQVRVTNLSNGLSVVVRVNDRGPWKPERIIDLSREAARRLDLLSRGTGQVRLEVLP